MDLEAAVQTSQPRLELVLIQSQKTGCRGLPVNQDWDSEASKAKPANCARVVAEAGQVSLAKKPGNGSSATLTTARSTQAHSRPVCRQKVLSKEFWGWGLG